MSDRLANESWMTTACVRRSKYGHGRTPRLRNKHLLRAWLLADVPGALLYVC
jgi:hypothetical protein